MGMIEYKYKRGVIWYFPTYFRGAVKISAGVEDRAHRAHLPNAEH